VWGELGSPKGLALSRDQNARLNAFLRSQAARDLHDAEIDACVGRMRVVGWLLSACIWAAIGSILFCAFTAKSG